MNNTKWKKFVLAINSIDGYEPPVNIKYVLDEENNRTFSPVWWEEIENERFELIEWIQISAIKQEYQGKLIETQRNSYLNELIVVLDKNNINYDLESEIFTVYGYK